MEEITELLIIIDKKISRIENIDTDFRINPKWLKLREQQEILYKKLAQKRIEILQSQEQNPKYEKKIRFYKRYLYSNYKNEK